jgi:plasmid stabilization system protein ParE
MTFRVRFLATADRDAAAIYDRIRTLAPIQGPIWYERLLATIENLQHSPRRCPLAPENSRVSVEVRQLLFGRKPHIYRVLFTITDDTVFILRIRGPRQQPL